VYVDSSLRCLGLFINLVYVDTYLKAANLTFFFKF